MNCLMQYLQEKRKSVMDIAYEAGLSPLTIYKILDGKKVTTRTASSIERATNGEIKAELIQRSKKQKIYNQSGEAGIAIDAVSNDKGVVV